MGEIGEFRQRIRTRLAEHGARIDVGRGRSVQTHHAALTSGPRELAGAAAVAGRPRKRLCDRDPFGRERTLDG